MELDLVWEPLQVGDSGGDTRAIWSGPFQIVPDTEAYPYFTCILKGPDNLALRCGSIRDAMVAAEGLANAIDGEGYDPDEDDLEDDEDDEDENLSFLPPHLAAQERRRPMQD